MSIPKRAIALVHVAKSQLGLSDESYRQILRDEGGVESSRDLDGKGLDRVLRRFAALGFQAPARGEDFGYRQGMATPPQIALIRDLWARYSGSADDRRLSRWLAKYAHCTHLRFLSRADARTVIEALKEMAKRQKAAREPDAGTAA